MRKNEESSSKYAPPRAEPGAQQSHGCLVVLLLCFLVAGMWWSLGYTFPDGTHMDFWGFVQLWGRELLLVIFAAVVVLLLVALSVIKWLRARFPQRR